MGRRNAQHYKDLEKKIKDLGVKYKDNPKELVRELNKLIIQEEISDKPIGYPGTPKNCAAWNMGCGKPWMGGRINPDFDPPADPGVRAARVEAANHVIDALRGAGIENVLLQEAPPEKLKELNNVNNIVGYGKAKGANICLAYAGNLTPLSVTEYPPYLKKLLKDHNIDPHEIQVLEDKISKKLIINVHLDSKQRGTPERMDRIKFIEGIKLAAEFNIDANKQPGDKKSWPVELWGDPNLEKHELELNNVPADFLLQAGEKNAANIVIKAGGGMYYSYGGLDKPAVGGLNQIANDAAALQPVPLAPMDPQVVNAASRDKLELSGDYYYQLEQKEKLLSLQEQMSPEAAEKRINDDVKAELRERERAGSPPTEDEKRKITEGAEKREAEVFKKIANDYQKVYKNVYKTPPPDPKPAASPASPALALPKVPRHAPAASPSPVAASPARALPKAPNLAPAAALSPAPVPAAPKNVQKAVNEDYPVSRKQIKKEWKQFESLLQKQLNKSPYHVKAVKDILAGMPLKDVCAENDITKKKDIKQLKKMQHKWFRVNKAIEQKKIRQEKKIAKHDKADGKWGMYKLDKLASVVMPLEMFRQYAQDKNVFVQGFEGAAKEILNKGKMNAGGVAALVQEAENKAKKGANKIKIKNDIAAEKERIKNEVAEYANPAIKIEKERLQKIDGIINVAVREIAKVNYHINDAKKVNELLNPVDGVGVRHPKANDIVKALKHVQKELNLAVPLRPQDLIKIWRAKQDEYVKQFNVSVPKNENLYQHLKGEIKKAKADIKGLMANKDAGAFLKVLDRLHNVNNALLQLERLDKSHLRKVFEGNKGKGNHKPSKELRDNLELKQKKLFKAVRKYIKANPILFDNAEIMLRAQLDDLRKKGADPVLIEKAAEQIKRIGEEKGKLVAARKKLSSEPDIIFNRKNRIKAEFAYENAAVRLFAVIQAAKGEQAGIQAQLDAKNVAATPVPPPVDPLATVTPSPAVPPPSVAPPPPPPSPVATAAPKPPVSPVPKPAPGAPLAATASVAASTPTPREAMITALTTLLDKMGEIKTRVGEADPSSIPKDVNDLVGGILTHEKDYQEHLIYLRADPTAQPANNLFEQVEKLTASSEGVISQLAAQQQEAMLAAAALLEEDEDVTKVISPQQELAALFKERMAKVDEYRKMLASPEKLVSGEFEAINKYVADNDGYFALSGFKDMQAKLTDDSSPELESGDLEVFKNALKLWEEDENKLASWLAENKAEVAGLGALPPLASSVAPSPPPLAASPPPLPKVNIKPAVAAPLPFGPAPLPPSSPPPGASAATSSAPVTKVPTRLEELEAKEQALQAELDALREKNAAAEPAGKPKAPPVPPKPAKPPIASTRDPVLEKTLADLAAMAKGLSGSGSDPKPKPVVNSAAKPVGSTPALPPRPVGPPTVAPVPPPVKPASSPPLLPTAGAGTPRVIQVLGAASPAAKPAGPPAPPPPIPDNWTPQRIATQVTPAPTVAGPGPRPATAAASSNPAQMMADALRKRSEEMAAKEAAIKKVEDKALADPAAAARQAQVAKETRDAVIKQRIEKAVEAAVKHEESPGQKARPLTETEKAEVREKTVKAEMDKIKAEEVKAKADPNKFEQDWDDEEENKDEDENKTTHIPGGPGRTHS
jgi:hypothetical protein